MSTKTLSNTDTQKGELNWKDDRTGAAKSIAKHIAWLIEVQSRPDELVSTVEHAKRLPEFSKLADLADSGEPDLGGGTHCFGKEYAPVPRTVVDGTGNVAPNPDYDPSNDYCGVNCWMGLWKPHLVDGEEQGNQGCLLLYLFSSVFGLPLPSFESSHDTNQVRWSILKLVPPFLDSLTEKKDLTMLNPNGTYTMDPGDKFIHNDGDGRDYVQRADNQYIQKPDGTFVTSADVAPVAATPPVAVVPTTPVAAIPTTQPVAAGIPPSSLPQQPSGIPAGTPVAQTAPPMAVAPGIPGQIPAGVAGAVAAAQTIPTATAAAPTTPVAQTTSVPAIQPTAGTPPVTVVASIDVNQAKDLLTKLAAVFGMTLSGNSNVTPAAATAPAAAKPGAGETDKPANKDIVAQPMSTVPTNLPLVEKFYAALLAKFTGYDRKTFKVDFFSGAEDNDLRCMCEIIGLDHSGWKVDTFKRTASGRIVKSIF